MILAFVLLTVFSVPAWSSSFGSCISDLNAGQGTIFNARIRNLKPGTHGDNYLLTAHANTRNWQSTWALSHVANHRPSDELWNIEPFQRSGKLCYRITKAGDRNAGMVLTAHSDSYGTSKRVLVHSAGHNIDDECWGFRKVPGYITAYRISKQLGGNQGMELVASRSRNSHSYWADVTARNGDDWRLEGSESGGVDICSGQ